jgi:hypothetical protein
MQLLDDNKKRRGLWELKEEALDCPAWRIRYGRGYITMIEVMTTWRMSKTDRSDSGATCYTVLKGCVVINLGKCATCVKSSVFIEHKITTWRQHKNRL